MERLDVKKLFDERFDSVRRFVYYRCSDSELASDIAQDVFAKVWEKGMNIDSVKDVNLLYKMASDIYISKVRRRRVELNYTSSIKVFNDQNGGDGKLDYDETIKLYSRALNEMSESERVAFLLSRSENLKYSEISQRLGIGVKAVEKRINGALKILKNLFKNSHYE